MTSRVRTFSLVAVAALGILAAIAGFVVRGPLERSFVLWAARNATGLSIDADEVDSVDGGYELHGITVHTLGGAAAFDAPSAVVGVSGHAFRIVLERPRFVVDPERYRGDEVERARHALAHAGMSDASFDVHFGSGTLTVVRGDVPSPILAFDNVGGSFAEQNASPDYNLSLNLLDRGNSYPIAGHSVLQVDGTPGTVWNAATFPLDALEALLPSSDAKFQGGNLRDLALDDSTTLHASARLDDVELGLGAHVLSHLHGPIAFDFGGVGTRGVAGLLDAVPFDAAGEIDDLPPHFAWLRDGSSDLRQLGSLVEAIANEPNLRSVHVESTAPGLDYAQYAMASPHGPLAISILSANPAEPTLRFDTAIAEDHVISGGERTSAMGVRTGAVAGVNGDYFDIGRTYQPQGLLVRAGELIRGPVDRAALAIDKANHVTIGEFHLVGQLRIEGRTLPVTQVNDWPCGEVTVITPAFGKVLPPAADTTFASLDPYGTDGKHYRVIDVRKTDAPIPVTFGVAFGPKVAVPVRPNDVVELSYQTDPPLDKAVAAIGGGPILLRNGAWYDDPHAPAPDERNYRWPVIGLARQADDHLLLVAVDGRHPERSVGMMRPEFGDLLLRLGAVDAMALDSGGSVTLVSRAIGDANVSVRNVPSDNSAERWVSDALYLYSSAHAPSIVPPLIAPTPVPEARPTP
jgi:exopolysaccharide biosynthesis protein